MDPNGKPTMSAHPGISFIILYQLVSQYIPLIYQNINW